MSNTERFSKATITGRQVAMLLARAGTANLRGCELLEWLEFQCDVFVEKPEQIRAVDFDRVLKKLADV